MEKTAADIDAIVEQNRTLSEQVKLLVRTEKQLYLTQRENEHHLTRVSQLGDFALESSRVFSCPDILTLALKCLQDTYPFHAGMALLIDKNLHQIEGAFFDNNVASPILISDVAVVEEGQKALAVPPNPTILSHDNAEHQKLVAQLEVFYKLIDVKNFPSINAAQMMLPIMAHNGSKVGFVCAFLDISRPHSFHDRLPRNEDIPFLSLIGRHIEAAVENASLHNQLELSAKELEQRVQQRTAELARSLKELKQAQSELIEISREAGMSEIATGILHNVGNVLNSVNVSINVLETKINTLPADKLTRAALLFKNNEQNLSDYLVHDAKGKLLPLFIQELANHIAQRKQESEKELLQLKNHIEHIKSAVTAQQGFAKSGGVLEPCLLKEIVDHAIILNEHIQSSSQITTQCTIEEQGELWVNKHNVLQILVNLIANARQSLLSSVSSEKLISISAHCNDKSIIISVADNGVGIAKENLVKIFAQGFSTKTHGHGFGLHSSAICAQEMGGTLTCHSEGVAKGAQFVLTIPILHKPELKDTIHARNKYVSH